MLAWQGHVEVRTKRPSGRCHKFHSPVNEFMGLKNTAQDVEIYNDCKLDGILNFIYLASWMKLSW